MNRPKFPTFGTSLGAGSGGAKHAQHKMIRGIDWAVLPCPRCGRGPIAAIDPLSEELELRCVSCGETFPVSEALKKISKPSEYVPCNLSDFPDYAAALGVLTASSARFEHFLCVIAGYILRSPPWHAHTAFYALNNNRARLDMVAALASHMIGSTQFQEKLDDIVERARRLASRRNTYVHAQWSYKGDGRKVFILENAASPSKSRHRHVSLKEMQEVIDKTVSLSAELSKLAAHYSRVHPVQLPEGEHNIPEALRRKLSALLPDPPQGNGDPPVHR